MSRTTTLILALLVLAGGVLGYTEYGSDREAETPTLDLSEPAELPAAAPLLATRDIQRPRRLGLVPGDRLAYRFEFMVSFEGGKFSAPPGRVGGVLELDVRAASPDGFIVSALIRDVTAPGPSASVGGAALVRLTPEGRFASAVFDKGCDVAARNLHRELLGMLQVQLPDGPIPASWESEEVDGVGLARVAYERLSAEDAAIVELKRSVKEYRRVHAQARLLPGCQVTGEGASTLVLDPVLREVSGSHTRHYKTGERELTFLRQYRIVRFKHERRRVSTLGPEAAQLGEAAATTFWAPERKAPEPESPAAIRGYVQILLKDLAVSLGGKDFGTGEQHRLTVDLLKRLQEAPAAAEDVRARVGALDCPEGEAAALTAVLGAAGSKECQGALLELLESEALPAVKQNLAVVAFLSVEEPIPAVDDALGRIIERGGPEAANGLLLSGAVGDRVRETDSTRFARLETRVMGALEDAREIPELISALRAVGNLGPAGVSERVSALSEHEEVIVRSAAAVALLRVAAPEADSLLADMAAADPAPHVRATALETLFRRYAEGHGDPNTLRTPMPELLRDLATRDEDEHVRKEADRLREQWPLALKRLADRKMQAEYSEK